MNQLRWPDRVQITLPNLVLLGFSILLIIKSTKLGSFYLIPLSYLLFTPFIFPVHLWSLTAYQSTLSVSLSFIALYFLQDDKRNVWYLSLPFAILSSLTFLDGISIFPILLAWLIVQKRWKDLASLGAVTLFYFYFSNFKLSSASKILSFKELVSTVSINFVAFSGSIAKILSDTYAFQLAFLTGILFLIVFCVSIILKINRKGKTDITIGDGQIVIGFLEIAFLRLLASAFMIGVGRSGEGGDTMMASRYNIYCICLAILRACLKINLEKEYGHRQVS